jgi:predicted ABC-class ATPase
MWYLISLTNRSKKEDHIVGTDQRRKTTLLEHIKEGRLHCWNRLKKEDHIVGTDQRRKTTLLEQIKEGRPNNVVFLL